MSNVDLFHFLLFLVIKSKPKPKPVRRYTIKAILANGEWAKAVLAKTDAAKAI